METLGWIVIIAVLGLFANQYLKVKHTGLYDKIILFLKKYWDNLKNYF